MSRFSRTVRFGKMPLPSGIVVTPLRARSSALTPVTSRPASSTDPEVGGISPHATCSVVDLPAPLGPSSATTVPGATARSTPCSTSMDP